MYHLREKLKLLFRFFRRGGNRTYDHRRGSPPRRDFNRGYSDYRRRSRSRSRNRHRERSRSRERYDERRNGRRERSRERSRERQPDSFRSSRHAIDKAKLLAIAQKNAVKLLNSNDLKGEHLNNNYSKRPNSELVRYLNRYL